jgi:DNA invertase Pin-like site-specific DNA recombinase
LRILWTLFNKDAALGIARRSASYLPRICGKNGWQILDDHVYKDAALSGKTKAHRKELKALEEAAEMHPRPFDYILFDDTSRLGRDQADVLNFVKVMDHHGIKVHFVSQQLDSSNENFEVLLNTFSMVDALHNQRLRSKVFSGQKGRVLAGFHVGSVPYGYETEQIENTDDPNAIGRAATLGSRLKIVEAQAGVIRRIFLWMGTRCGPSPGCLTVKGSRQRRMYARAS